MAKPPVGKGGQDSAGRVVCQEGKEESDHGVEEALALAHHQVRETAPKKRIDVPVQVLCA